MTGKGLLVLDKDKRKGIIKNWPKILVLQLLSFPSMLVLSHVGKEMNFSNDALESLKRIIEHYKACEKVPSPLFPEWIPAFLKEDEELLEKGIEKLKEERGYEKEVIYSFLHRDLPSAHQLLTSWKKPAQILYGGVFDERF